MTIGNNIRKYRKELKLTQAEVAKRVGVLQHHVNRWENDRVVPSIEHLKPLAKALEVTVDALLFADKEKRNIKVAHKELLDKLKDLDKLTPEDRITITNLIDTFTSKK